MAYHRLRCRCGRDEFVVSGSPRHASGGGGHLIRTLRRAWQEARQTNREGGVSPPPFVWPPSLRCDACQAEGALDLGALRFVAGRSFEISSPRESYRCRACRRGVMQLGVGVAHDDVSDRIAVEVVARCCACAREARIAARDERPSAQEIKLDQLYGRR